MPLLLLSHPHPIRPSTPRNGILPIAVVAPNMSPVRFQVRSFYNPSVIDFGVNWLGRELSNEPIGNLMQYSMKQYQSPPLSELNFDQGFAHGTEIDGNVDMRDSSGDSKKFCDELKRLMVEQHGTDGGSGRFKIETSKMIRKVFTAGAKVVGLSTEEDGNIISGDNFVVAAGTGSRKILKDIGVPCPTVPIKGYLLTFSSSTQQKTNSKLPKKMFVAPMGMEEGGRYIYRLSGLAEFGGKDQGVDWEGRERAFSKRDRAALDMMRGVIEEKFDDVEVVDEDYGYRCLAPDDVPLIGRTKYSNLFLNTGHGSKGWTMGAGAGKLCAQLVLGMRPEIEAKWYDPLRFEGPSFVKRAVDELAHEDTEHAPPHLRWSPR